MAEIAAKFGIQMKNDRNLWYCLLVLGALALINSTVSTLKEPEGVLLRVKHVIAVHWINTIVLIAGLSPILFPQKTLLSESAIVTVNLLSLVISGCCGLVDLSNLIIKLCNIASYGEVTVKDHYEPEPEPDSDDFHHEEFVDPTKQLVDFMNVQADRFRTHLVMYNSVDLIISVSAAILSFKIIVNRVEASPKVHLTDSRRLQGYGVSIIMLSVAAIANHLYQRIVIVHMKHSSFLNLQTIDEFCWLSIAVAIGVVVLLSSRGNQILQTVSFILCGAAIYPCYFYAWLDFRILTSLKSNFLFRQSMRSLILGTLQIAVFFTTFLTLALSRRDTIRISLNRINKLILGGFSAFFLMISALLVFISIYTLMFKEYYKIFHASEHKLPFLSFFLFILTGLSIFSHFNFITISITLVIAIFTMNSTYLHIFSYFYLWYKGYFIDQLTDDFFMQPEDLLSANTTEPTGIHYLETSLNGLALSGAATLIFFCVYLSRTALPPPDTSEDSLEELENKKKLEKQVWKLGGGLLLPALFVASLAVWIFTHVDTPHPLVTIYSQMFHLVLAGSITSFALFQVLVANHLSRHPLLSCSLVILSIIRSLDILTQIDYKDIGNQPLSWTIHSIVEFSAMFLHFITIAIILKIDGPGRPMIEPAEIPLSFENPLGNATDENGYIMLRTAENEQTDS